MVRLFISTLLCFLVVSCKTQGQVKSDMVNSVRLFKEGGDLMLQGFKLEFTDSLASIECYKKAIGVFLNSYRLDTTNIESATYLSGLYAVTQDFDSALLWGLKLLPSDSVKTARNVPIAYANSLTHVGFCYLNTGDIKAGESYLHKAIAIDKSRIPILIQKISDISDAIFYMKSPVQVQHLVNKNIIPCKYSIDILNLGLQIGREDKNIEEYLITPARLQERKTNCR